MGSDNDRLYKTIFLDEVLTHAVSFFVSDPGNYNTPSKCVFVAAFPERKTAVNYVQYMFGKKRYAGKDVAVRKAADYEVDPGEGIIDGVVTALGEELIFENGVLVD